MSDRLDPIGFVADELAARGALVERADDGDATALVPAAVAAALGVPEIATLAATPRPASVFCGLGSPVLDRLISDARRTPALATTRWTAEPPRVSAATAMAERLAVRNGVAEILGAATASATYVIAALAWTAEADDRYQGLTVLVVDASTGGEPDSPAQAAMRAVIDDVDSAPLDGATMDDTAARTLARRGDARIRAGLGAIDAAVARRRDREVERQVTYFRQLVAEARSPRRQITPAAKAARIAAIEAEAAAKRRDVEARYAVRVTIAPAARVVVAARVVDVRLRLRRRKGERELVLRVPPGARQVDAVACAACAATTRAILLCDDELHVLCEACAPVATGRPTCAACARPRGR